MMASVLLALPSAAAADRPSLDTLTPANWHLTYNKGPQLELLSSPPRVQVRLDGPSTHGGTTPFSVPGNLRGSYTLEAFKPGFVYTSARLDFVPSLDHDSVAAPLPSSRSAVLSAAIPPGWLEWSERHRVAGLVLGGSEVAAITGALYAHKRAADYSSSARSLSSQAAAATGDLSQELGIEAAHADRRAQAWRRAQNEWLGYGAGLWVITFLSRTRLAPSLQTHFDEEGRLALELQPVRRSDVLLRSLLLPGWGQTYEGRLGAGHGFMASGLGMIMGALAANHAYQRAEADLVHADQLLDHARRVDPELTAAAQTQLEHAIRATDSAWTVRNLTFGLTAALWAYNLFDAYYFSHGPRAPMAAEAEAAGPEVSALTPLGGRVGIDIRF